MGTDQDALKRIWNLPHLMGKLVCWCLRLLEFEFEVIHRARIKYHADDALPRIKTTGTNETFIEDDVLFDKWKITTKWTEKVLNYPKYTHKRYQPKAETTYDP